MQDNLITWHKQDEERNAEYMEAAKAFRTQVRYLRIAILRAQLAKKGTKPMENK